MPQQTVIGSAGAERAVEPARQCSRCGRPEGLNLRVLPDGRWYDMDRQRWRDGLGGDAEWPDIVAYAQVREAEAGIVMVRIERGPENPHWTEEVLMCKDCSTLHQTGRRPAA